jgi:hypothetical protein
MATDDFQDIYDIDNMGDDDLKDLVLQELREYPEIDVDLIEVQVREGAIRLSGRVGTEQEVQQVEHVITDLLGVGQVANELVVDELVRGARSEGADDAWIEENEVDSQIGGQGPRTSDTAAHLMEDTQSEHFGTHDVQEAIERGTSYEPPDRIVQQGNTGLEEH